MRRCLYILGVLGVLLLPASLFAQGTIAGTVKDTSGAVLPGVTVTAASPALIEGSRSVVTDASGLYRVSDLRPGSYSVTFALEGFATVKREGIVLQADFTAAVNAELKVGSLQETITVTGASPVVDVKSTSQQQVLTREILNELPAVRVIDRQAQMLPGVLNVVPAGAAVTGSGTATTSIHGSATGDSKWLINGLPITFGTSGGGNQQAINDAGFEQVSVDDGSGNAESSLGGARFNVIPKEGGNTTSGLVFGNWHPSGWQNNNLTSDLQALGVGGTSKIDYDFDVSPAVGGPIMQSKLWYFAAYRQKGTQQTIFNTFTDASGLHAPPASSLLPNTASGCATGDPNCFPLHSKNGWYKTATGRLTYQATKRDKIGFSYEGNGSRPGFSKDGNCSGASALTAPEACSTLYVNYSYYDSLKWTSVPTNKLLVEVVFGKSYTDGNNGYIVRDGVGQFDVSRFDSSTGIRTGMASASGLSHGFTDLYATTATGSYITGSHAFKVGMNLISGHTTTLRDLGHGDIQQLTFVKGVANAVVVDNTPFTSQQNLNSDLSFFGQDSWSVKRLTLNLGLRFNHFNESVPDATAPAGIWVPARTFSAVPNVPNWNDVMPRFGAALDVFDTGKTALKFGHDEFVAQEALGLTNTVNPLSYQSDSRKWTDLDGNGSAFATGTYTPQLAEIGASTNNKFGLAAGVPSIDPNLKRPSNWSYSATVQQELLAGVSVSGGYFRRNFKDLYTTGGLGATAPATAIFNTANDPATSYTPFTIVGPSDPRLPNGGGELITLYNLNASQTGLSNQLVRSTANRQHYDGYEINFRGRLPNGGNIFGGITYGRTAGSFCDVSTNPNDLRFCNKDVPYQGIYKLGWYYRLPWQFSINGTYQDTPGAAILANYTVTSANSGTTLTGGISSIVVWLQDPSTKYLPDVKTLDLRLTRAFSHGRMKAKGFVDMVNALNFSTILAQSNTFGATWQQPTAATAGRYFRIGTEIDF